MIKTNLKATNIELTGEIAEYVEKKISALEKFLNPNDGSVMCDIEIGRTTNHHQSGDVFKAEINMHIAGKSFYAVVETDNLNAAIDEVKDEIGRALGSHRKKQISLVRRGGAMVKAMIKGIPNPFRRRRR